MLLIIPSVHIRRGLCSPPLEYFDSHHLPGYEAPSERTRLLRMENAKSIHLFFDEAEPYSDENLNLLRQIRTSVDLPLSLTVKSVPTMENVRRLYENGIYRIGFRSYDEPALLKELTASFPAQQLSFFLRLDPSTPSVVALLRSLGACRMFFETESLDDATLVALQDAVAPHGLRLSVIVRVLEYENFARISRLAPNIDSLILDGVLEHDSFPCEKLWRLDEERAIKARGGEANLWRNPLEGIPHI